MLRGDNGGEVPSAVLSVFVPIVFNLVRVTSLTFRWISAFYSGLCRWQLAEKLLLFGGQPATPEFLGISNRNHAKVAAGDKIRLIKSYETREFGPSSIHNVINYLATSPRLNCRFWNSSCAADPKRIPGIRNFESILRKTHERSVRFCSVNEGDR